MLEQSVKLSRLIIFYFISNFLIYAPILPNREPKTSAFRSVFVFRAVFQLLYSCFGRQRKCVLQMPTIAVFARNWSGADPNFVPFRWRIWFALSEFLCLLANQNVTLVTLFCTKLPFLCTQLPFFCTVLPKNCIPLNQSQSRNFFMYIIICDLPYVNTGKMFWGVCISMSRECVMYICLVFNCFECFGLYCVKSGIHEII